MKKVFIKSSIIIFFILLIFKIDICLSLTYNAKNSINVSKYTQGIDIADAYAKQMFKNCLIDTLDSRNNPSHSKDSTIAIDTPDNTTYIITGDINGMWLRDSCAQLNTYVYICKDDNNLKDIIRGTIRRHIKHFTLSTNLSTFVNAWDENYKPYDYSPTGHPKYEADGIPYVIRLCWTYWKITGDTSWTNNPGYSNFSAHQGFNKALEELKYMQTNAGAPQNPGSAPYTGMVWCTHRPSDDECWDYNTAGAYLVPDNMFIAAMLPKLKEIYTNFWAQDTNHINLCDKLYQEITSGISNYAVYNHSTYGKIWAYEVDGYGNYKLMDDANVPSLLSAPYIGFCSNTNPIYQNTRKFLLSSDNPYYYSGSYCSGIGSPHTPSPRAWPMAIIMQGLTSDDPQEIQTMLEYLTISEAGKRYMHEGVDVNNPGNFSRPWFTWPDSLYAEFIIKKILGLNYYPDTDEVYVKPFLNNKLQYTYITNGITFGNKTGLKIQSYGTNSNITSATLNGSSVSPDTIRGVKITADNDTLIIHTSPAKKNYKTIDLSSYVNRDAISWDWNRMDSTGDSSYDTYYLNLKDHQLFSAYNGMGFKVGNWSDGQNNIISCAGQVVSLNNLMASNIYIFGWAENGDQSGTFRINYLDGNYYEISKTFSDWCVKYPQYDEEHSALIMGHRQHKIYEDEVNKCHIFQYKIPVAYFKELNSIELPYNENMMIFAITLDGLVSISAPSEPTWISATPISEYQIDLLWQDLPNETSYTLFRNTINDTNTATNIAGVSGNITNYNDTSLATNTTYFYWLKSYNSVGASGFSSVISNTTLPPSAPTNPHWVFCTVISPSQINLKWNDTLNETNYELYRNTSNNTDTAVLIANVPINITNYNDFDLSPDTTYYYWLKAGNVLGVSGFSVVISNTTSQFVDDGTLRFAIMADSRGDGTSVNTTILNKLCKEIAGHYPVKLFFPGDLIGGQSSSYAEFNNEYNIWDSAVTNYIALTNCMVGLGNHENGGGTKSAGERAFNDHYFYLPNNQLSNYGRTVYYYDYIISGAKARFIMLNSDHTNELNKISSAQRRWLDERLTEADELGYHKIIFFHEPSYPTGQHIGSSLDIYATERNALWTIIDKHNVDIVFSGHEHNYSRRHIDSTVNSNFKNSIYQVITGGAGAPLNGTYSDNLNVDVEPIPLYHYIIGKIQGEYINFYVYATNNEIIDQFQIYRNTTPKTVTDKIPKPVVGFNFSRQGKVINIRWAKVNRNNDNTIAQGDSSISYYNIYRSVNCDNWQKIGETVGNSFTDILTNFDNRGYYYKINAVNKAWNQSEDWGYIHSSSKIIIPFNDNSGKLVLPLKAFNELLKGNNNYKENLWIIGRKIDAEKSFVDNYEIKILKYSDDAVINNFKFNTDISISFYYDSDSIVSSVESEEAGINFQNIDKFLKIFRYNEVEWINQGGIVDKENDRILLNTRYMGKFGLKIEEHTDELELIKLEPKKIFTPFGSPPNNEMRFYFENPDNKKITFTIYNLNGKKIKELPVKMNNYNDGYYYWDGRDKENKIVPGGIYIYQLKSDEKIINGSILLVK